jgi:DNA-binding MarR family transcriptional regulator
MALIRFHEEKGENPNQIKIINLSKLDKMTVSNALKDLVKREFVARVENPEDTRAKNLSLTGKGNDLIKKAVLVVEGVDHGYFSALTAAEHETLIILLNKLS